MKIQIDTPTEPLTPVVKNMVNKTITIFLTPFPTKGKMNWRCPNCGKIVFQYNSEVSLVVASSEMPKNSTPIDIMCRRCHLMHRVLW